MKNFILTAVYSGVCALALFLGETLTGPNPAAAQQPSEKPAQQPAVKKVDMGKNVQVQIEGDKRRVVIKAYVCLRQGQLEQFMTRKRTKEHEAILAADVDAEHIHTALLLANAVPGHPVKLFPKFEAATGTTVKISLEYTEKGKTVRVSANKWIKNSRTMKDLDTDWVFGGSVLYPDPEKKRPPFYAANDGDIICVSNFDTALLDLPISSSQNNNNLEFEAHTDRIPALDTPVLVILEPVPAVKKKKG